MAEKIFPRFQQLSDFIDFSSSDVEKLNEEAAAFFARETDETEAFLRAHPEYFPCPQNAKLLEAWLYLRNDPPFTLWNLEIALRDLQADHLLAQAPPPEQPVINKWAGITQVRSDALFEYVPSDAEIATLAKLRDDSNLNDAQRKARLKKLSLLAGQQRRELAPQNLYR